MSAKSDAARRNKGKKTDRAVRELSEAALVGPWAVAMVIHKGNRFHREVVKKTIPHFAYPGLAILPHGWKRCLAFLAESCEIDGIPRGLKEKIQWVVDAVDESIAFRTGDLSGALVLSSHHLKHCQKPLVQELVWLEGKQ